MSLNIDFEYLENKMKEMLRANTSGSRTNYSDFPGSVEYGQSVTIAVEDSEIPGVVLRMTMDVWEK